MERQNGDGLFLFQENLLSHRSDQTERKRAKKDLLRAFFT